VKSDTPVPNFKGFSHAEFSASRSFDTWFSGCRSNFCRCLRSLQYLDSGPACPDRSCGHAVGLSNASRFHHWTCFWVHFLFRPTFLAGGCRYRCALASFCLPSPLDRSRWSWDIVCVLSNKSAQGTTDTPSYSSDNGTLGNRRGATRTFPIRWLSVGANSI